MIAPPKAPKSALDLLEKMLQLSPLNRITIRECLNHKYFESLHDEEDEEICLKRFDFSFEKKANNIETIKSKLF